jgi:3-hydroxyacyl-CoA dehydrogenase
LYGAAIHVLVEPTVASTSSIDELLRAAGIRVERMGPIDPSLEDVFISLIGAIEK